MNAEAAEQQEEQASAAEQQEELPAAVQGDSRMCPARTEEAQVSEHLHCAHHRPNTEQRSADLKAIQLTVRHTDILAGIGRIDRTDKCYTGEGLYTGEMVAALLRHLGHAIVQDTRLIEPVTRSGDHHNSVTAVPVTIPEIATVISETVIPARLARKRKHTETDDDDNKNDDVDRTIAEEKLELLQGSAYRGRELVGEIRKIRSEAGLSDQFEVRRDENNILSQYLEHLENMSVPKKSKENKLKMICKMMCWVQTQTQDSEQNKPVDADVKALWERRIIHRFYYRLGHDLDGSGSGIGLQATAMKNEFAALKDFLKFVLTTLYDVDGFYRIVQSHLVYVDEQIKTNSRQIARAMTKKHVKQGDVGIQHHPMDIEHSVTNERVATALAEVIEDYTEHGAPRCSSHDDYSLVMGYLVNLLSLTSFQRPGAVEGMTLDELRNGLREKAVLIPYVGKRYEILVADHKTGSSNPAVFYVNEEERHLLNIFTRRFRPARTGKVFLTMSGTPINSGSSTMTSFQAKWGLDRLLSTDSRAGVEQMNATNVSAPGTDISVTIAHSAQTGRKFYQTTVFREVSRVSFSHIHRMIQEARAARAARAMAASDTPSGSDGRALRSDRDTEDVSPASSVSSVEAQSVPEMNAELREKMMKCHPCTTEARCPVEADIRVILTTSHLEASLDWRSTAPKRMVTAWREEQTTKRAKLFRQEFPRVSKEEDVTRLLQRDHPIWGKAKKLLSLIISK